MTHFHFGPRSFLKAGSRNAANCRKTVLVRLNWTEHTRPKLVDLAFFPEQQA